ncbi:MAG: PilZ domain-containing protein [Pseudomonadota bacterium]
MRKMLRKDTRIEVEQTIHALIGNGPYLKGKIIDIGQGGLAFEHSEEVDPADNSSKTLHIVTKSQDFYITGILCRVAYNIPHKIVASGKQSMRCGVRFENLNPSQHKKLSNLIVNGTFGFNVEPMPLSEQTLSL